MDRIPQLSRCINNSQNHNYLISTAFILAVTVLFFLLISDREFTKPLFLVSDDHRTDLSLAEREDMSIDRVLKKAAMEDNTVIVTVLNAAWAKPGSVLDQFLESFRIGDRTLRLLNHLVIVALDMEAYKRCKMVHRHCLSVSTPGVDFSGKNNFMTDGYLKMVWRKIDFLGIVLQKGYNFIFTDTDILWFRDPLPVFYLDGDFQISCDDYRGNPLDMRRNRPNSGLSYVKSNNRTIEFYKFWYRSRLKFHRKHDQSVFNLIKHDPFIKEIGLQIKFLDTAYFGGLCQISKDFQKVRTMHVNCCIGLKKKVLDLRAMLEDWKRFLSFPPTIKNSHSALWSVPKNCSLKPVIG
ncbi:Nucleotide-diphospho-sugar transferase family protein [Zostera marina]|uniref:Glycosyltransferase n=1 Tax=Zostera marina TaxID=29655 RepID=A0A0K9NRS2_ZOSMR|nr:Nucleotide-diphospho-sugar transferase family protein [Zostera marina]